MARLAGKVALISGGARGQGAAEARLFTQEGAKVVFGDILDAAGKQAVQHAKDHIRCNSVHPGPIDTPMVRGPQTDRARVETLIGRVPLGRLGTAEEIAYGVLYLASDEASFVTGSELVIDGGRTAQ